MDVATDWCCGRVVLAAADGAGNPVIAADVGVHVDTARKWRWRNLSLLGATTAPGPRS